MLIFWVFFSSFLFESILFDISTTTKIEVNTYRVREFCMGRMQALCHRIKINFTHAILSHFQSVTPIHTDGKLLLCESMSFVELKQSIQQISSKAIASYRRVVCAFAAKHVLSIQQQFNQNAHQVPSTHATFCLLNWRHASTNMRHILHINECVFFFSLLKIITLKQR